MTRSKNAPGTARADATIDNLLAAEGLIELDAKKAARRNNEVESIDAGQRAFDRADQSPAQQETRR